MKISSAPVYFSVDAFGKGKNKSLFLLLLSNIIRVDHCLPCHARRHSNMDCETTQSLIYFKYGATKEQLSNSFIVNTVCRTAKLPIWYKHGLQDKYVIQLCVKNNQVFILHGHGLKGHLFNSFAFMMSLENLNC